ncbi:MAG: ABC transporter permease [Planctomycetota bacterium]|nr:ABC transporter permease [Planctomycetota bacterium]
MILEFDILPYWQWLLWNSAKFALGAFVLTLLALVVNFLILAVRHGPLMAGDTIFRVLTGAVMDVIRLSPRRVYTLARLAVRESMRRRVWIVFVVFAMILFFAGWFLDPNSQNPVKLYLSFVMWATTCLVALLGLFLSTFSIPNDMKNKVIYTIVTKPVRSSEIVLGRMLGFTFVGTVLLMLMGFFSYLFVTRSLRHTHEMPVSNLQKPDANGVITGVTSLNQNHHHEVRIDGVQDAYTDFDQANGHRHSLIAKEVDGKTTYEIGPREDLEIARVPVLGELEFVNNQGDRGGRELGVSVGHEWRYRRFIEGNSPAAVIWTFDNVTPEQYSPDGLLIERTIRVFRTHKGKITEGISGNMFFRNPETQVRSTPLSFTAKENRVDSQWVDRRQFVNEGGKRREVDLYKDLVSPDGKLEVWIQCTSPGQYFGAARSDLYLRAGDNPFAWNLFKGYLGIWFLMVLVISFGVMFSTFLSGPVAFLATLGILVISLFANSFIIPLADAVWSGNTKNMPGGGPVESIMRWATDKGITAPVSNDLNWRTGKSADLVIMAGMTSVAHLLPDLRRYSNSSLVETGFDVPANLVWQQATTTLAFFIVTFIIGLLFLRTREVAR